MSSIHEKIKSIANERNLTVSAIENGSRLSNGSIGKWEKSSPRADQLYKVAKFLNEHEKRLRLVAPVVFYAFSWFRSLSCFTSCSILVLIHRSKSP